jgi:hypothetical protein
MHKAKSPWGLRVVPVQIITLPNALTRADQIHLPHKVTGVVAKVSGAAEFFDPFD